MFFCIGKIEDFYVFHNLERESWGKIENEEDITFSKKVVKRNDIYYNWLCNNGNRYITISIT